MHPIFARAQRLLNLDDYHTFVPPLDCGSIECEPPKRRQYILRMMVQRPGGGLLIPGSIWWLRDAIKKCIDLQESHHLDPCNDFIYVTVRHGIVTSEDDDVWHVDGFSMRRPHRPEQNYCFSDTHPTEILAQGFEIPKDFNPLKHNIQRFFQDRANHTLVYTLPTRKLCLLDPYIVHRRPRSTAGQMRTFFRISFVPIEIEDDTCQQNPLMPPHIYDRDGVRDFRNHLSQYLSDPTYRSEEHNEILQ